MDGPTIFLGIVMIAVTAMVIYMFVDVSKFKETTQVELKQNDMDLAAAKSEAASKVAAETKEREGNVNYIIDKTNEANQNLYTRFDKDVNSMQTNLDTLNNASAAMSSVMRVTGGPAPASQRGTGTVQSGTVLGGTATNTNGRAITELPGSGTPNLELISSVMATNGMTVKKTTKTDKLQLGDKFLFSGVGDAHANDDWLRMFNKDGTGYHGGIAMNKLWTGSEAHLNGSTNVNGTLNIRGGSSEHNQGGWSHFNYPDGRNYIRGDTEIRGNTNNIGDLNVGRNASVQGRLHFSDASMSKAWSPSGNNTDSYYLEKKVTAPNVSSLRLTINDDNSEAMEIWGGSCAAGDCSGEGKMKHRFDGAGNASHIGMLKVNRSDADKYPNGWGNGVHAWDVYVNGTVGAGQNGGLATYMNSVGDLMVGRNAKVNGTMKIGHPHGDWTDRAVLSTQATGDRVGASFAGEHYWTHFPWVDQHTYIRPGREDRSIIIGDVGQNVHLGRNDGGGITQVKSHWLRTRRHIDADIDWGGKGTTLFTGWVTDKSVIGNHKTGGHDFALNAPANTVVSTNPVMVNGDVEATRICTGNVCFRGEGDEVVIENKNKTKTIAHMGPGWDKIKLYTNSDGKPPYWYANAGKGFGVWG